MSVITMIIFHTFSILDSFTHSCKKKFPTNKKNEKKKIENVGLKNTGRTEHKLTFC